jgi:hypothetical protein
VANGREKDRYQGIEKEFLGSRKMRRQLSRMR